MRHLYFVRHGLSQLNRSGLFAGRTETPLHDDGREQARQAGKELQSTKIDCIISSPMERTLETAELIAEQIGYPKDKIITNEIFIERDFGPLEGATYTPNLGDVEGVEGVADIIDRAKQGLEYLNSLPYDSILLVSHGAVGRALRHNINPEIPFNPSPGFENAKVVKLI